MKKKLNPGTHILTSGRDIVSEHIEYIFNMIAHRYAKGLVNQIAFNENLPQGQFGSYHGPSRSICVNIKAHIAHILAKIANDNPSMSIRALLIMEFVNTALHEGRHAKYKDENRDFSDAETDGEEKICQTFGDENMWDMAQFMDLEVQSFGKFIDDELLKLFNELKDAKNTDTCKQWQLNQLNMIEKGILFLDEENEIVLKSMFEVCSYFSKQSNWSNAAVMPFSGNQTHESESESSVEAAEALETYEETGEAPWDEQAIIYLHHPESGSLLTETDRKKADEMMEREGCLQEISKEQYESLDTQYKADEAKFNASKLDSVASGPTVAQYEDYDALSDFGETEIVAPIELPEMVASPDLNTFASPVEVEHEPAHVQTVETISEPVTGDPRVIAETVFRRLFHHLYSKCGWDGQGRFLNAGAVLEGVPIDDIAGASSMFKQMDTMDAHGTFQSKAPVGAFITGKVSKQELPMYTLYLNMNGQLVKRTFIPQNPDKKNTQQQLTKWALQVRDGWRITMLLEDGAGVKLDMRTEPTQVLGQESFNIWTPK